MAVEPSSLWSNARQVVSSQSFIEKLLLLLLTVGVSGVAVPLVMNRVAAASSARQKAAEAIRARDQTILDAQSKLLNDFAETLLAYETLALDVSWYKTAVGLHEDMHTRAFNRYSERVVDLISRWRALVSRARTLASPSVAEKMNAFMADVLGEQDTPIVQLYRRHAAVPEWERQHQRSIGMLTRADALISELAVDLRLSRNNLQEEPFTVPQPRGTGAAR